MEIEDMEDDFGELYAGVEERMTSSLVKQEEVVKHEKRTDPDSDSDFDEKSGNASEEERKVEEVKEEDKVKEEEDNGSDSEDDLHIVLNEEDCVENGNGNGNVTAAAGKRIGSYGFECGEEDELGFGSEKDRKRGDMMAGDGLEQAEGGSFVKSGYHSQYKYIRPHTAAFPCNTKTNGAVISSPSSFRGDWDPNGCSQQIGSCSGSYALTRCSFLGTSHSGSDFFLPRYRTIFDVNINMFERKPWRHPGVDITDFFNFDLDEESWKHYCNHMEQFRQQTSLRPNQVYETDVDHQSVGSEAVARETAQTEHEERVGGVKTLDIPKGRAIEVEGGIGERRPSMDIRRPRQRDSDVVIQIAVQDSTDFSSDSSKEEQGRLENSKLDVAENDCSSLDVIANEKFIEIKDGRGRSSNGSSVKRMRVRSLRRCSRLKSASDALLRDPDGQENRQTVDGCPHESAKEHVSGESDGRETVENMKEENNNNFSVKECSILKVESLLEHLIQPSSSLSYPGSYAEASKTEVDVGDKKVLNPAKRKSRTGARVSVTSDLHHSKDSESSDGKTELAGSKYDVGRGHMREEKDYSSRVRLCSVAELKNHMGDDRASRRLNRDDWYDRNHLTKSRSKRKQMNDYEIHDEDLAYYRETEVSLGYCNGRLTGEPFADAHTDDFRGRSHVNCRDEMDPYFRRHWDESEYFFERSITVRGNEAKPKRSRNRDVSGVAHRESTHLAAENSCLYTDKERYRWHRRKRSDEHWFRRRTVSDEFVLEQEYREEFIQDNCERNLPYYSSEMERYEEKYDRRVSYKNTNRRDRCGGSPPLDLVRNAHRSNVHDQEYWEYPENESLPFSDREFHARDRRRQRDITSARNAFNDLRRLDWGDVGHWRDTHSDTYRDNGWYDSSWKDDYDSDEVIYPDEYFCADQRRYTERSRALDWHEDKISTRYWNRGRIFAEETSFSQVRDSRNKAINYKHNPTHGQIVHDEYRLGRDRKRTMRAEIGGSVHNTQVTSNLEIIEKDKDEKEDLSCRESVDLHLFDWERKSSGRCSIAGDAGYRESMNHVGNNEQKNFRQSNKLHSGKITPPQILEVETNYLSSINSRADEVREFDSKLSLHQSNGTFVVKKPITEHHETSALEEGQLPMEEAENVDPPETDYCYEMKVPTSVTKDKTLSTVDGANENKVVGGYDNNRIQETLAKMAKRRERFKEPIALKELDKNPKPQPPQPDTLVETTTEVKQNRPARKRRWGGS